MGKVFFILQHVFIAQSAYFQFFLFLHFGVIFVRKQIFKEIACVRITEKEKENFQHIKQKY